VHRGLREIEPMVDRVDASPSAKDLAIRIFRRIAKAEAKVHGCAIEEVHFHEVGAIDSLVDILGSAIAWDSLGLRHAVSSPVPTGYGQIRIAHGVVSLPAPATAELLRGIPLASCPIPMEMTTPTGAAFLAELVSSFGPVPAFPIEAIGLGAGTRDLPDRSNVLRILIGDIPLESSRTPGPGRPHPDRRHDGRRLGVSDGADLASGAFGPIHHTHRHEERTAGYPAHRPLQAPSAAGHRGSNFSR